MITSALPASKHLVWYHYQQYCFLLFLIPSSSLLPPPPSSSLPSPPPSSLLLPPPSFSCLPPSPASPLLPSLGAVNFIGHVGECVKRFQVEAPIHSLLLHREEKVMAVVTQDMVLYQYSVSSNGQTTQTMQVGGKGDSGTTQCLQNLY